MRLISLVGAAKEFGIRTLFSDLDLHIGDGERPVSYTHLTLPTNREV